MIQRRQLPAPVRQDFDQNWERYEYGFGNLTDSFWIGKLHHCVLTKIYAKLSDLKGNEWATPRKYGSYCSVLNAHNMFFYN